MNDLKTVRDALGALDSVAEYTPHSSSQCYEFDKNLDIAIRFIKDVELIFNEIVSDVLATDEMLEKGFVCGMSLEKQLLIIKIRKLLK